MPAVITLLNDRKRLASFPAAYTSHRRRGRPTAVWASRAVTGGPIWDNCYTLRLPINEYRGVRRVTNIVTMAGEYPS